MIDSPKPMNRDVDPAQQAATSSSAVAARSDPEAGGKRPSVAPTARRVLFLDDDPQRAEAFLRRCPEAVWVLTAKDCIARLEGDWDEVHLDHDLGGEQYVDVNRDDCGMAVVRWLCAEGREGLRDARFFIHSYNFAAASLMVECLLRNGYTAEFRPFGFDLVDFLSFEPPPPLPSRFKVARRRLVAFCRRLLGRGISPRVSRRVDTRYDGGATPTGEEPVGGRGSATTPEKEP